MKFIRLLATLLLVAVCAGFSSCEEELEEEPPTILKPEGGNNSSDLENTYSQYIDDYKNMTCKRFNDNGDTIEFTGITAKGYLMINLFQEATKKKVFDWVDNVKIDTICKVYKGYGEYEEVTVKSIGLSHAHGNPHIESNKNFITLLDFFGGESPFTRILFVNGGNSKMSNIMPIGSWSINTSITNWYNNEYCFIHDCCYTLAGDTVYTIKYGEYDYNIDQYGSRIATNGYGSFQYQFERVSAEEAVGIGIDTDNFNGSYQLRLARINYKTAQNIWGKEQYVELPFEYEAKAKLSSSIIQKSSEIWTYNIDIVYYDGTEKEASINVDIKNGSIIEEEIPVTLANLEGTWDMVKCYGWEYNDNYEKEDWKEDVTGEYIFFEDEDGNGGYNDGYKTYYFASSVEGNKLVLRNSEWLSGKEVTITKLTTNELHLKATDSVSEENYEMKRR